MHKEIVNKRRKRTTYNEQRAKSNEQRAMGEKFHLSLQLSMTNSEIIRVL